MPDLIHKGSKKDLIAEIERLRAELREAKKPAGGADPGTRDLYGEIIQALPEGIAVTGGQRQIMFASKSLANLYGFAGAEDLTGRAILEFVAEEDRERARQNLQRAVEGDAGGYQCYKMIKNDGSAFSGEVLSFPLQDGGEGCPAVVSLICDVSERKRMEEMLKSQAFLLERISDAVIGTDPNFIIRSWNSAAERLYGWKAGEVIGQNVLDVLKMEFSEPAGEVMARFSVEGYWAGEATLSCKDGSTLNVVGTTYLLKDDQGSPLEAVNIHHDVTGRKQAEKLLQAEHERLVLAQKAVNLGMWDWDMLSGMLTWSKEFYTLFGLAPETPASFETFLQTMHPDDRQTAMATIQNAIDRRILLENEYRIILPDGQVRWIGAIGNTYYDENGKPLRMIGYCINIDERKRAEEALKQGEATLRAILNAVTESVFMIDVEGIVLAANETTSSRMGLSLENLIGKNIYDILPPANTKLRKRMIMDVIETGRFVRFEDERQGIWFENSIYPILEEDGCVKRVAVYGQDITRRKNMERTMVESEKLAGIGTLAAGIAHEINTPLQIITGTSETLHKKLEKGSEPGREELERRLQNINENAWRISAIVRSLLDYARSPDGAGQTCSLNEVVLKTLTLTEHQFKSWSNVLISTELGGEMPQVNCDPNQITQVLVNLLSNARDAMPAGGQIHIKTVFDPAAEMVVLRVADTGHGIPSEIRAKIFDPFFTTKPPGEGTGLGLSISAGILRAHGGALELENTREGGSIFKISLPPAAKAGKEDAKEWEGSGRYPS